MNYFQLISKKLQRSNLNLMTSSSDWYFPFSLISQAKSNRYYPKRYKKILCLLFHSFYMNLISVYVLFVYQRIFVHKFALMSIALNSPLFLVQWFVSLLGCQAFANGGEQSNIKSHAETIVFAIESKYEEYKSKQF